MLLLQVKNNFIDRLVSMYGKEEAQQFFYMLSEVYLSYAKVDVALNLQETVSDKVIGGFEQAIERLLNWEPIQYIIGSAYFYGNEFLVTN